MVTTAIEAMFSRPLMLLKKPHLLREVPPKSTAVGDLRGHGADENRGHQQGLQRALGLDEVEIGSLHGLISLLMD